MRVLLTGGAGFVGRHVTAELGTRGHETVVMDALVEQVHGPRTHAGHDVRVREHCDWLLEHCDAVVHLAAEVGVGQSAYTIERYVDANCRGTAVLLEAIAARAAQVKRLVVASSMSVYGEGQYYCGTCDHAHGIDHTQCCVCCGSGHVQHEPTSESCPARPTSVYAITKRDQEELCLVVGAHYRVPTIALRFFNIYGPGQALSNPYTGVIAIFASQLLNGRAPTVYEDGEQTRDFVHVADVARAVVDAVEAPPEVTGPFNVGTGRATSIGTVARILARELGGPAPVITGQTRAGDVRHCVADVSRIRDALGWSARIAVEDGLRDLVPYLRAQSNVVDRTAEAAQELAERGLVA